MVYSFFQALIVQYLSYQCKNNKKLQKGGFCLIFAKLQLPDYMC